MNNFFFFFNSFCDLDLHIDNLVQSKMNSEFNKPLFFRFDKKNVLSKDGIINLQNILSAKRDTKTFVIIKDFQELNKEVINSLLLFLEENHNDVYFIFASNEENYVLDTIKSRCTKIYLNFADEKFKHIINQHQIVDKSIIELLKDSFFSVVDLEEFINSLYDNFLLNKAIILNDNIADYNKLLSFFKENDLFDIKLFLFYWLNYFKLNNLMKEFFSLLELLESITIANNMTIIFNAFIQIIIDWRFPNVIK